VLCPVEQRRESGHRQAKNGQDLIQNLLTGIQLRGLLWKLGIPAWERKVIYVLRGYPPFAQLSPPTVSST
jgi:hypothetical protein